MNLDARPQDEVFAELEKVCAQDGFIHILAALVFENNFHTVKLEERFPKIQDQYDDKKLIRNELSVLHGLMLKHGGNLGSLSDGVIQEQKSLCYALLDELHGSYYSHALREGNYSTTKITFSHSQTYCGSLFSMLQTRHSTSNSLLSQLIDIVMTTHGLKRMSDSRLMKLAGSLKH